MGVKEPLSKTVITELNRHFAPTWSNENLRERVIEFGESLWLSAYSAAIEDAAKVADVHIEAQAETIAAAIRKLRG